jgi:hypothetical protein
MGKGRPVKRRICGFVMLLMVLISLTLNQKFKMFRHIARSVEIGKEMNEQRSMVDEKPQEKRWENRNGRKLSSAIDVWGFVQGAISHAVDEVGNEANEFGRGTVILGHIIDASANVVIDTIKNELDSSSSEDEVASIEAVEPIQEIQQVEVP